MRRHLRALFVACTSLVLSATTALAQQPRHVPTIDDLINLRTAASPAISPDGRFVVYGVTETSFKADAFITQLWLVPAAGGAPLQLTRGDKSSTAARWSPDGTWLAFLSDRVGERAQIFLMRPDGGEPVQITKHESGINSFEWAPDGKSLIYAATEAPPVTLRDRRSQYADFEVVRKEYNYVHLWSLALTDAMNEPAVGHQRTRGKDFSVGSFAISPDSRRVAFTAAASPDLTASETADIYVLDLNDSHVQKIVAEAGPDTDPHFSPDGSQIVFASALGRTPVSTTNRTLAIVPVGGNTPRRALTNDFDEDMNFVRWDKTGIYFSAPQKTNAHLFRIDPRSGRVTRISNPDTFTPGNFSFSADGRVVAFNASSATSLPEIFITSAESFRPRQLTQLSDQLRPLVLGTRELISWKSKDGASIEGVLIKPADFDPARKYPLLCVIHGGPRAADRLSAIDARYYPVDLWAARGALVLKVNYRGSTGYGEKFRTLNVRNLGVGDAWDILSGIDSLVARGWADPDRLGCMGWSQGGYISAFLTTSTDRFKAISVGAGISDWATYYYNTDITDFTINYLGSDPVSDPEIYRVTSPISYVAGAKTPTLIQHGELDRRVPIANAYELRQALENRHVPVEMVVYKGFGHGINRPKAMRAVMTHNLVWFNHYIWGDELPDLRNPSPAKVF